MKKKNTIITALIALFIVFAGVKSVSADHVINKSETERISKLINGMTQWLKASYDEDFKKQKVARNSGVFYWGTNGELAWYKPEDEIILDPFNVTEYEKIHYSSRFDDVDLAWSVYIAETNRLRGYDSFDKIKKEFDKEKEEEAKKHKAYIEELKEARRNMSEEEKRKEAEYREKLITDKKYVNEEDLKYVGDVLRNHWGIFYWGETGKLAWYHPETGKVLDPVKADYGKTYGTTIVTTTTKSNFESGDHVFASYVAEINKCRGYDSLEKIKEGMKKPKSDTTVKVEEVPAKKSEEPLKKQDTELKEKKVEEKPTTQKQGWVQVNGKWFYYDQSNNKQSGWVQVNGAWYYLAQDGEMKTGWLNQGGSWYYLTESGSMKTGWYQVSTKWYYSYSSGALAVSTTVDGYTVNANGEWI